ncbi:MAG: hypothetical protein ACTSQG_08415 [Promethearchaeota archaeon]
MGCLPYDITIKFWSWTIVIIYCAIISMLFLVKMSKAPKEIKSQREMFRSIALFFLFYIGVRIFFLLSDFERDANCESILYFQYVFLGYICGILAFLSITYFGEKYIIRKTKNIASSAIIICVIIDIIIVIFLPYIVKYVVITKYGENYTQAEYKHIVPFISNIVRYFNYAVQYSTMGLILVFYIYLIIKSTGTIRRNALVTLLGLAIAATAAFLETDALISSGLIPPFVSPIIFTTGVTIFAFAYLRTIK